MSGVQSQPSGARYTDARERCAKVVGKYLDTLRLENWRGLGSSEKIHNTIEN